MQAANLPMAGAAAMGPSPSSSTAVASSQRISPTHSSSGEPSQDQALRFVANHHRQHNPHDPKLRANPSFKSRRSSLLGSVLKSKAKDDARKQLAKVPPRTGAPIAPKPRSSSASVLHRSNPPPTSNSGVAGRQLLVNIGDPSAHNHDADQQHHSHSRTSPSRAYPESSHSVSHDTKAEPSHLGHSPPLASLSSPVDLSEGPASNCSSNIAESFEFAPVARPAARLATHNSSLISSSQTVDQASKQGSPGVPLPSNAASSRSPRLESSDASSTQCSHSEMPSQQQLVSTSPDATKDAAERPSGTKLPESPTSPFSVPIITHTVMPSDTGSLSDAKQLSSSELVDKDAEIQLDPSLSSSRTDPGIGTTQQRSDDLDPRLPTSTSAFVTSPQRFSSLGRQSATRLTLDTDIQGPSSLPRGLARDINEELESPTAPDLAQSRTERRMSMLDFLAADTLADTSPQLVQASLSAEDLPRSVHSASHSVSRSNALVPASIPLVQASRQLRLEVAAARGTMPQPRKIDLCDHVRVSVEPLVDRLTMFGSMQSSSNYSLAGSVVVKVPKLIVPRLSAVAAVARDGSTSDHPTVHVETLTVRFIGYAVYVDATGRFNSIKLTEISQELLQPQGFSCPVEMAETGEQPVSPKDSTANPMNVDASQQSLKYETEFDLSIPGWLPGSQRSRFGATFYCVQATAVVEGQAVLSALSAFDGFGMDSWQSPTSSLNLARSLESEVVGTSNGSSPIDRKDGSRSPPASTLKSKSKNTWLNKTAKQLQLRASRKSTGPDADPNGSHANSRRGSGSKEVAPISGQQDPLFSKTTEASNQTLPNGQHSIKSECLGILVRRCRDIVPVPVARLARLATASQVMREDGTTPSLSQSMLALARLQDGPDAAPASEPGAQARSSLPSSVSAPVSLAALGGRHQTESARASVPLANPTMDEASSLSPARHEATLGHGAVNVPALPTLAPSPRIGADPRGWGSEPGPDGAAESPAPPSAIMPRAPSAFDVPRDPAKLAAATSGLTPSATLPNMPSSMSRASSLFDSRFGNANSPPRTSSRSASATRTSAPLRHFVHKPTLHLPPELGLTPDKDAAGGLNFSLTLSLPSHVHVAGPKSDVLSFGVQIDLGRTEGWDALKKWGGLRLKDMELVCLQTERHSSMPSRSFCSAFPVPPPPNKVDAADLPVVTSSSKKAVASGDAQQMAAETRLRQSYDRSLVLSHIALANRGKAPHPIEHNVERIRTTIVGPPPFVFRRKGQESGKGDGDSQRKGKAKINVNSNPASERQGGFARSPSRSSPAGSGTNTPDGTSQSAGISSLRAAFAPTAQIHTASRASVMQPLPRALARSNNSSSSSLRQAFQGTDGSGAMQPQPRPNTAGAALGGALSSYGPVRNRRPIPFDLGAANETLATSNGVDSEELHPIAGDSGDAPFADAIAASSQPDRREPRATTRGASGEVLGVDAAESETQRRINTDTDSMRMGISSSVTTRSATRPAAAPRRRRFENAISRLSTFASSMLEQPPSEAPAASASQDDRSGGSVPPIANATAAAASLRATYAFSGDDGQGVDLTKGRVRMTINLPLVSSDMDAARKAGSAHLIPDFESPYVRVRHKLKVKLGFGLKSNVASGQDGEDWAQALVMCVPVRFTEAPPKEVQEQFGPVRLLQPANAQTAASGGEDAPAADRSRAATTAAGGLGPVGVESSAEPRSTSGPGLPETFAEPLLPAYAQLFREDGSRLADEGEDLPRYPGRMSVVGEIDEDPAMDATSAAGVGDVGSAADQETIDALSMVHQEPPTRCTASHVLAAQAHLVGDGGQTTFSTQLPRDQSATMPRLSDLRTIPTPMDRTTSLPGHRLLTRTNSSGVFGLRTSPSHPALPASSQSATSSPYAERSSHAGIKSRLGSSAFDPLPPRPGMRRRSATIASLATFSRITPAEVLDEALVTSAMDDEEDRMDGFQPSHTLDSLHGRSQHGLGGLDSSGQDDEDDEEAEEEMDEEDIELDGVDSPELGSESDHATMGMHIHSRSQGQLSGSEGEGENVDFEVGRAL